jgi:pimeloyl-ACP methyl ester carboxylesterase
MIIQGDQDMIKLSNAQHMNTLIQGSQLCILPGTSHFVHGENPELVLAVITPYLMRKEKLKFEFGY